MFNKLLILVNFSGKKNLAFLKLIVPYIIVLDFTVKVAEFTHRVYEPILT